MHEWIAIVHQCQKIPDGSINRPCTCAKRSWVTRWLTNPSSELSYNGDSPMISSKRDLVSLWRCWDLRCLYLDLPFSTTGVVKVSRAGESHGEDTGIPSSRLACREVRSWNALDVRESGESCRSGSEGWEWNAVFVSNGALDRLENFREWAGDSRGSVWMREKRELWR